jgi:hypothetical protein
MQATPQKLAGPSITRRNRVGPGAGAATAWAWAIVHFRTLRGRSRLIAYDRDSLHYGHDKLAFDDSSIYT